MIRRWWLFFVIIMIAAMSYLLMCQLSLSAPAPLKKVDRRENSWPCGIWEGRRCYDYGLVRLEFYKSGTYCESTPEQSLTGHWTYDPWDRTRITAYVTSHCVAYQLRYSKLRYQNPYNLYEWTHSENSMSSDTWAIGPLSKR